MKYSKPEINSLGDAARIIQQVGKLGSQFDGSMPPNTPAYDLDE